jgi:hypothetical protein
MLATCILYHPAQLNPASLSRLLHTYVKTDRPLSQWQQTSQSSICHISLAYNRSDGISRPADCAPSSTVDAMRLCRGYASIRSHTTRRTAARVAANRTWKPTNRSSLHSTHTHAYANGLL